MRRCAHWVCIVFLSIFLIAVISHESPTNGFQVNPKLTISTDQAAYTGNATIVVSGAITQVAGDPIMIIIVNPSGTPIASNYVTTDEYSGMYQTEFKAGSPAWRESGVYNITASWQFCPASVFKSTTFTYSGFAISNFEATISTHSITTVTPCDTKSTTEIGISSTPASSGQFASRNTIDVGIAAIATVLVILVTLFVRRVRIQKRTHAKL